MAYLNFTEIQGSPVAAPAFADAIVTTGFSALEWSVIAVAQNDRLSSLVQPGRMSVALGALFGGKRPNPRLADDRLEALRRMAVHAWHKGYAVPREEIGAFHEAGYTSEQYETLLASISQGRGALNRARRLA